MAKPKHLEHWGVVFLNFVIKLRENPSFWTKRENEMTPADSEKLATAILDSYGDRQKREIMNAVAKKPLTLAELVEKCNIPLATCYRKIGNLIQQGLLTYDGSNGNKFRKYKLAFKDVKIELDKDNITVELAPYTIHELAPHSFIPLNETKPMLY